MSVAELRAGVSPSRLCRGEDHNAGGLFVVGMAHGEFAARRDARDLGICMGTLEECFEKEREMWPAELALFEDDRGEPLGFCS